MMLVLRSHFLSLCLLCWLGIAFGLAELANTTHHRRGERIAPIRSHKPAAASHAQTSHAAQLSVDCQAFVKPIRERRSACLANSTDEVDLCVYFASDYRFVVPFLVHHLSIGVSNIFLYNNDEKVAWYNHPAVLCLISEGWVDVQPWFGEKALHKGLDHCYRQQIPDKRHFANDRIKREKAHTIWGANFDIDEMLVLHKHQCFPQILQGQQAPSVAVNWAFFLPEAPLNDFGRTGNAQFLPRSDRLHAQPNGVILPHDMLTRRMAENPHIKTITRITCTDHFDNEHCPVYTKPSLCPYGIKPIDPQGKYISCSPWTPWVDNHYPVAQLNHYWTLSLQDFLRKIHRGKGGGYAKVSGEEFRNTREFFSHAKQKLPFVDDMSFITRYGELFDTLKRVCPACFDVSYYYLE